MAPVVVCCPGPIWLTGTPSTLAHGQLRVLVWTTRCYNSDLCTPATW
jgi:hypothetical protein